MAIKGLASIIRQHFLILLSFLVGLLSFQPSIAVCSETDSLLALLNSRTLSLEEKAVIHGQLAYLYQHDNPDSAFYHASKGLQGARTIESARAIVKNLVQLGYYYYLLDSLDLAKGYYQNASEYFDEETDLRDMARTWNVLGSISSDQSDYFDATKYYLKAIDVAESMHDTLIIASISNNLGILYKDLGEQDQAYMQYKRSAEMFEYIGDSHRMGYALNNMVEIQTNRQQYDSAKSLFARAKPLFLSDLDHYGLANLHFNMASIYLEEDSLKKARMNIELGLEAADQLGTFQRDKLMGTGYNLLGRLMFLEADFRQAIVYLHRSYVLARDNQYIAHIGTIAELLALSYEQLGMIDSTVFYYREYIAYFDSLTKLKNEREIARIRYEDALMLEKENFRMQTELLAERSANRNRIILLVSVIVLAVFLMIILYLRFRMKRNALVRKNILLANENLSERLESRNKEVATHLLYLEQKNNMIQSVSNELKEIVPKASSENRTKILETIRKLNKGHSSRNWEEFNVLFREIHSDFYIRLNNKYPDLTPNEQKLCAFLLLNMSTKEIAGITYQSYESIRMARHRLRRKLNVESDTHLVSFLNQL